MAFDMKRARCIAHAYSQAATWEIRKGLTAALDHIDELTANFKAYQEREIPTVRVEPSTVAIISQNTLARREKENAQLTARVAELDAFCQEFCWTEEDPDRHESEMTRLTRENAELRAQLATAGKQLAELAKLERQREEQG